MRESISYDPIRDFLPITALTSSPNMLVVHPSVPVKSVKELIALAKARPGEINYASGAVGAPPHLAGELFKAMTGVNIVVIPYKGAAPAMNALIGGEVQLRTAEVKDRFFKDGAETVGNSPEQFGALIKSDMTTLGKVIKDSGIRE